MVAQECAPCLRGRPSASDHVFGDRRLGDLQPELQQFTMDTRSAPQRVFLAHLSNEFAQLAADPRPPRSSTRLPAPIGPNPCPLPAKDRVGINQERPAKQ